jgi:hypothetical protein
MMDTLSAIVEGLEPFITGDVSDRVRRDCEAGEAETLRVCFEAVLISKAFNLLFEMGDSYVNLSFEVLDRGVLDGFYGTNSGAVYNSFERRWYDLARLAGKSLRPTNNPL